MATRKMCCEKCGTNIYAGETYSTMWLGQARIVVSSNWLDLQAVLKCLGKVAWLNNKWEAVRQSGKVFFFFFFWLNIGAELSMSFWTIPFANILLIEKTHSQCFFSLILLVNLKLIFTNLMIIFFFILLELSSDSLLLLVWFSGTKLALSLFCNAHGFPYFC